MKVVVCRTLQSTRSAEWCRGLYDLAISDQCNYLTKLLESVSPYKCLKRCSMFFSVYSTNEIYVAIKYNINIFNKCLSTSKKK